MYILNGTRNADMAAYLAYLALSSDMGSFDDELVNVSRVEYLAPQPILPAVKLDTEEGNQGSLLSSRQREGTRPWAVGAGKPINSVCKKTTSYTWNSRVTHDSLTYSGGVYLRRLYGCNGFSSEAKDAKSPPQSAS